MTYFSLDTMSLVCPTLTPTSHLPNNDGHCSSTPLNAMSSATFQHIPINREWAVSLSGLRLQVWWDVCNGDKLYSSMLTAVDFSKPRQCYFKFELDNEHGTLYPM